MAWIKILMTVISLISMLIDLLKKVPMFCANKLLKKKE